MNITSTCLFITNNTVFVFSLNNLLVDYKKTNKKQMWLPRLQVSAGVL